ncbi:MAG: hypothetical protein AAGE80_05420 [Pseudomonadota bacterium]
MKQKPILCLDFDGVIHSYTSGWKGADVIPDPPVPGAFQFINAAMPDFDVHIFSSRSNQPGGIEAMQEYMRIGFTSLFQTMYFDAVLIVDRVELKVTKSLKWPTEKPPAMVTIDDRAITFTGEWPEIEDLLSFKPWNKQ